MNTISSLYQLINTAFNLYIMIVILRLWLQWARADFYNPLSQITVKLTQPILAPMRRIIPGYKGFDFASLLLAYLVVLIKFGVFIALSPTHIDLANLIIPSVLTLIKQTGSLIFWVLIARAILSWISQGRSSVEYVLSQLTEPLLAPIRRIIPSLGGLDLSVMILFLLLQLLNSIFMDFLAMLNPLWAALWNQL